MGRVLSLFRDGLLNAMTGTGTSRDPRRANSYVRPVLTQADIAASYSGSGMMRKIVRTPALDMVREWRDWSGLDDEQAAKLFDEEKRLAVRQRILAVETLRGLGGGALILGLPGDLATPAPTSIGTGGLRFIHAVSRWHLKFDTLDTDANSETFGEPLMWKLDTTDGQQSIHPSRVIPFRADTSASTTMIGGSSDDVFWGEAAVQQCLESVQDYDAVHAGFAALANKARVLRVGVRGLYEMIAEGRDGDIFKRLAAMATGESLHNAIVFDAGDEEGKGGEKIEDATYSFAGAKDMLNAAGERVAAIADIPATRLLGRAPEGMNASGDSQQVDWNKRVRAMQTLDLAPCLDRLDRYLIPSALGSVPPEAAYEFAPLDTESQGDRATRFKTLMEGVVQLQNTATVPDQAFNRGVQSLLVEEAFLPELEAALAGIPDDERYGILPEGEEDAEGGDLDLEGGAGGEQDVPPPLRRAANDAAPRPLYVRRNLVNAADLVKWAKANGFSQTLAADDMHVTILYSRNAVDPIEMGEAWGTEADGSLVVRAGGPRALEKFGEGAAVLQFASSSLSYRHEEMVRKGASHDWPEYLPHVTITYEAGDIDLAKIKPFTGELRFGPEIFEPLDEDWKSKIEEG